MSLQGTLTTLGISDVLEFLASRQASGKLEIATDTGSATYWLTEGGIGAVEFAFEFESGVEAAAATYYALQATDGTFLFDDSELREISDGTTAVTQVLQQTDEIASKWADIEQKIPSVQHLLRRSPSLHEPVSVSPRWWEAIEQIADGVTSLHLAQRRMEPQIEASGLALELVHAGLMQVEAPVQITAPVVAPAVEPATVSPTAALETASVDAVATPSASFDAFVEGSAPETSEPLFPSSFLSTPEFSSDAVDFANESPQYDAPPAFSAEVADAPAGIEAFDAPVATDFGDDVFGLDQSFNQAPPPPTGEAIFAETLGSDAPTVDPVASMPEPPVVEGLMAADGANPAPVSPTMQFSALPPVPDESAGQPTGGEAVEGLFGRLDDLDPGVPTNADVVPESNGSEADPAGSYEDLARQLDSEDASDSPKQTSGVLKFLRRD